MPYHEFVWTERAIDKIDQHGLTVAEVEYAVLRCRGPKQASRDSGLPLYIGRTQDGTQIVVVFEELHATQIVVVTAYPIGMR
jgi:uncharacterized DUF497 family protein